MVVVLGFSDDYIWLRRGDQSGSTGVLLLLLQYTPPEMLSDPCRFVLLSRV